MTAAVLLNPFNDICEASGLMNSPSKGFVLPAPLEYMCEKPFPDLIRCRLDYRHNSKIIQSGYLEFSS
jgi:hypothetical protein